MPRRTRRARSPRSATTGPPSGPSPRNIPAKFAVDPRTPKAVLQVAYVGVAEDGSVINVTLAPMLYYREFEQDIFEAVRQWKYAPQALPWCGEAVFNLALEPKS